jgi:hypothetical protein
MRSMTRFPRMLGVVLLLTAVLLAPRVSTAQATRGTLLGTITDQSGGALPGVTVTATETRTNLSHNATTNATGNYTLPNIPDGIYNIKAELQGFKTVVREAVRLTVNSTVRSDLALQVGGLEETVTVTGETPLLQTDRTDTGRTLESIQVASMPLAFNRNFQGMMATVPGATRPYKPHSEFFNSQDSLSSEINGQTRMANNVQIEGIDNNHRTGLLTVLIPPAEAIDQVSVSTSNFDAEFGRAAGAVTNVTLKSGTNTLRGSAFWFGNTDATNAKPASVFFTPTTTKPPTKYNQGGFTIGGPVRKNKLFFFGDYQYTHDILGTNYRFTVPTPEFRNGDLSAAPTKVYDPATGTAAGAGRTQFANNQIPAGRISPIARAILATVPMPNISGVALGQPNYQVNMTRSKITHGFDTKLTYALNDSNQLSWRLSFQRPQVIQLPPADYGDWGGPLGGGFMATGTNKTYSTGLNWTRTFSNTFLMEARGGLSYYRNQAVTAANGKNLADQLGIKGVNLDEWTSGPTTININNGFSNPVIGYVNSLPWNRYERTWEFASTFTKLRGNHTIKFGVDWRHNTDMLLQIQDNQGTRGGYTFSGAQTGSTTDSAAANGIANAFASFLLDAPSGIARDIKVLNNPGSKHWAFFTFVHDKYQVSKKVTLDLGMRWEYYDPFTGLNGKGSLSNYDPVTNRLVLSGYGDTPLNLGVKKDFNNFSPRLGLSYRLDDKTVVRGGFGGSTTPFPDNRYAFNYPVKQNNSFQGANSYSAAGSMAAGFPAVYTASIPDNGIIPADTAWLTSQSFKYVPNDLQQGTIYSYNVAFQRELIWNITGEVAYVGNFSNEVLNRFEMNAGMTPGLDNAGRPLYKFNNKTSSVENLAWKGKSRYNGLQVKLDRKFRGGWLVTNSYTFGHSKDYANENGGPSTPADPQRSWGYSNFDRAHTYVGTFVWSLPWFKDGNAAAKYILGHWQLSGIFTAMTGQPLDITMSSSAALRAPSNTNRPNMTGNYSIINQNKGTYVQWFDTSAFTAPADNTWGNMTRNMGQIRGPGMVNFDMSLVKQFPFGGSRAGEFRFDVWNLTNHVNLNNPNTSFGGSTFGQINGAYGERQMRFSVRFTF